MNNRSSFCVGRRAPLALVYSSLLALACAPTPAHRGAEPEDDGGADAPGGSGPDGEGGTGAADAAAGTGGGDDMAAPDTGGGALDSGGAGGNAVDTGTAGSGGSSGSGGSGGSGGMSGSGGSGGTGTPPPAPGGLTATAGNAQVSLSWSAAAGAIGYNVKRGIAVSGPFTTVGSNIAATSYVDQGLMNGSSYAYVVTGVNAAGEGPASSAVSAAPTPWSSQDIGAVPAPGGFSEAGSTMTVAGSGDDIYNMTDAFRFVFQTVNGDATLVARVVSIENKDVWSKAGVMMRDGLTAGASNVLALTSATASNGYRFQSRTAAGGTTVTDKAGGGSNPVWLRVVRRGNAFTAGYSSDGKSWTTLGSAKTVTMPPSIMVGLAVCSHTTVTANGVFDNVTVSTP